MSQNTNPIRPSSLPLDLPIGEHEEWDTCGAS